jgi:hypothetical protein
MWDKEALVDRDDPSVVYVIDRGAKFAAVSFDLTR